MEPFGLERSSNHCMIRELMGFCRAHYHWNVDNLSRLALDQVKFGEQSKT
jgi:hypothetical protein